MRVQRPPAGTEPSFARHDTHLRRAGLDPLWDRIRGFPLDDSTAALPFTARLARDHLWSEDFAARVVMEYRKFLYLMATGPGMVTPSQAVDEVWHLHLGHTRSYWDDLCGKFVGRPLHHEPTRGGADEGTRFRDACTHTLQQYAQLFGEAPPPDIWPAADDRFAIAEGYRTVRVGDYRIMRRLWSPKSGESLAVLGMFGTFVGSGLAGLGLFANSGFAGAAFAMTGTAVYLCVLNSLTGGNAGWIIAVTPTMSEGGDGCGGCGGCGV